MMGFVLAGAAAFVLTACSGNNASQSTEAAATTVPETQTESASRSRPSTMRSRAQRIISSAATHLPSQRTMKAC